MLTNQSKEQWGNGLFLCLKTSPLNICFQWKRASCKNTFKEKREKGEQDSNPVSPREQQRRGKDLIWVCLKISSFQLPLHLLQTKFGGMTGTEEKNTMKCRWKHFSLTLISVRLHFAWNWKTKRLIFKDVSFLSEPKAYSTFLHIKACEVMPSSSQWWMRQTKGSGGAERKGERKTSPGRSRKPKTPLPLNLMEQAGKASNLVRLWALKAEQTGVNW